MSHNTWMHRIVRVAVKPLVNTPVTPNHLTTLRLLSGLGAAGLVALGSDAWRGWGAGLFLLSMFLDRADGDLARLSGKTSPWGHSYDLMTDAFCNAIIFVGLGYGMMAGSLGPWALLMGLLAGFSVGTILLVTVKMESLEGARSAELSGFAGFDPDDGMLAVPILIWLGQAQWLLLAAAIGAPLFAIFVLWKFRRALRSAPQP